MWGPDGDQLALAQQLGGLDLKAVAGGVEGAVQRFAVPQLLFLRCDARQCAQNFGIHGGVPPVGILPEGGRSVQSGQTTSGTPPQSVSVILREVPSLKGLEDVSGDVPTVCAAARVLPARPG